MFHIASHEEVRRGDTTDIYFRRTGEIIEEKGIDREVVAEVTASSLPHGYSWAILAGVEEVATLLEGYNLDAYTLPEGSVFYEGEPVLRLEGSYSEFCELETPLLGLLCQASGIATKAARFKKLAGERSVLSFGIRRMHPAIAPMIDRSAYIGGCDGFSGLAAERLVGKKPSGTMPHALIITTGEQREAWKHFDDVVPGEVPRIALVDTYCDEKQESIWAAENIENLYGVRLDTPGSRRGEMEKIVEEVRWELDIRGYKDIKIFVSGGIREEDIDKLKHAHGFGVGTSISASATIDFALDIVDMEGMPVAKRGKLGGKKLVYRCPECLEGKVVHNQDRHKPECSCGREMNEILLPLIRVGGLSGSLPGAEEIRSEVLRQLEILEL